MVRRGAGARFMPGAWVFPGGVVDDIDRSPEAETALPDVPADERPWLAAAIRELAEESGIWLSDPPRSVPAASRPRGLDVFGLGSSDPAVASRLAWFSNWVTPTVVPVRFDARFYVAEVPADTDAAPDEIEVDAVQWVAPSEAVVRAEAGEMLVAFPTAMTLRHFAALEDVAAILGYARDLAGAVPAIQPRLRQVAEGDVEALLPGDPGFDDIGDQPPETAMLAQAARVRSAGGVRIPELERSEAS